MRLSSVFSILSSSTLWPLVSTHSQEHLRPSFDYDAMLAFKAEDIPTDRFTTFLHPTMPSHSLRIKRHTDFCDTTVRSYTGYLDAAHGTQHIFFYYFESRNDPTTDPVVMWFNGGPGCSSSTGIFMENGPCRINEHGNATSHHKYGWNDRANIVFIDQPVNVGFSYADHSIEVMTTVEAGRVINDFVRLFFEAFPSLKGRALHLTGESYAGHYVPIFGSSILDGNDKINSSSSSSLNSPTPINLQSVAIGNGLISWSKMLPSWYKMLCTPASVAPSLNVERCVKLKQKVQSCQTKMQVDCEGKPGTESCLASVVYCSLILEDALALAGRNPYDLSKTCDLAQGDMACYKETGGIDNYLNLPAVRKQLGIPPTFGKYKGCSQRVESGFIQDGDFFMSSQFYLEQLIERGIRVLLYDGVLDLYCNRIGYLEMADSLDWPGQTEFSQMPVKPWFVGPTSSDSTGIPAGRVKTVRRKNVIGGESVLSWVEIDGAGHMAPFDKPLESLVMINKWLADKEL
ncbi:serine carboxypeptidase [Clavulina sp. PMI_390]|nr:serine carboxypeptidase [Clavulina sp. PMI_390]